MSSLPRRFDNFGFSSGMLLSFWARNELSHVEIKDMNHPVKILLMQHRVVCFVHWRILTYL